MTLLTVSERLAAVVRRKVAMEVLKRYLTVSSRDTMDLSDERHHHTYLLPLPLYTVYLSTRREAGPSRGEGGRRERERVM